MQPSTTDIDQENPPYKLNVFLFGNDQIRSTNDKQFSKYTHKPNENDFSSDDDDEDTILSGRNSCLFFISGYSHTFLSMCR